MKIENIQAPLAGLKARDYHIHTDNSFDSKAKMQDYCQRAIELGLIEVAFMEHFDLNPSDESKGYFNYEKYMAEIKDCRTLFGDRLKIRAGLELGEPHEYHHLQEDFKVGKDFDFFIGSVHFVKGQVIHRTYEEHVTANDICREYFSELWQTVERGNFNILAHIDVIKRYLPAGSGVYNPYPFKEILLAILQSAIRQNIAVEINSSGMRQRLREPLPAWEILSWYKNLGGKHIVFASDAHKVEDLAGHYKLALEGIRHLGFADFSYWHEGEWK